MCGIAGFADPRGLPSGALAERAGRLVEVLRHRGPDDEGIWMEPAVGLAFAHTRLAVIDPGPAGAQPMRHDATGAALNYNGELYNAAELRRVLEASGVSFRGRSDTEVVLEALVRWGPQTALARFEGMFALAYWDPSAQELWLARDRLGEKPLYYGEVDGAFAFASELRALRRLAPGGRLATDPFAVAAFLQRGVVPGALSIHRGVAKLPPGTFLRVRLDATAGPRWADPRPYWRLEDLIAAQAPSRTAGANADEAVAQFAEVLQGAVGRQLTADVPVGLLLSGGVDSALLAAVVARSGARDVRTFAAAFEDAGFDESPAAQETARALGTRHEVVPVTAAEALAAVPTLADVWDEPFADSSQLPMLLLARAVKPSVTVALGGEGADELFAGYVRHRLGRSALYRDGAAAGVARGVVAGALRALPDAWVEAAVDALARGGALSGEHRSREKLHSLAAALRHRDLHQAYRAGTALRPAGLGPAVAATGGLDWPASAHGELTALERLLFDDLTHYLPDDLLVKADRAGMAASLEMRLPYLDAHVVSFAWGLPDTLKLADGQGKRLPRRLLEQLLPDAPALAGPKRGFAVPVSAWLRADLRPWAEDLLAVPGLARHGMVDVDAVRRLWREHLAGTRDHGAMLWAVLMLRSWEERW